MEEAQKITPSTLQGSPDVLIEPVEVTPLVLKKGHKLPRFILGLSIFLVLVSGGLLIWKIKFSYVQQPDLIVKAPEGESISLKVIPTPIEEISPEIPVGIIFENKPYRNDLEKFQINIPLGWQVDDSGSTGSVLVMSNPQTTTVGDKAMLTYVYVSAGKASGETLANYVLQAKEGLQTAYKNYLIEEDDSLLRQGIMYHVLGGSYLADGVKMKNRNIFLIFDNRGYAISATAPELSWASMELLLNATLFSFKNF